MAQRGRRPPRILGKGVTVPGPLEYLTGRIRGNLRNAAGTDLPLSKQIASGTPGSSQPVSPMGPSAAYLSIQAWFTQRYASSLAFFATDYFITVPANSTIDAGIEFVVPAGRKGVLKELNMIIKNSTFTTDVFVRIKRNNAAVQGWDQIPYLNAPVVYQSRTWNDIDEQYAAGERIGLDFINNTGAAVDVGAQFSGWTASESEIDRLQGGLPY